MGGAVYGKQGCTCERTPKKTNLEKKIEELEKRIALLEVNKMEEFDLITEMLKEVNSSKGRPKRIVMGEDALEKLKKYAGQTRPDDSREYCFTGIPIDVMESKSGVSYIY